MSKYSPLKSKLALDGRPRIELGFQEIDRIVGGLPASAHQYPAWWANDQGGAHVQAQAWLEAGYRVEHADLMGKRVRFVREGGPAR